MNDKRNPVFVKINNDDLNRINKLSVEQSKIYGYDTGYFILGRNESSHRIGFIGEVGVLRFFKERFQFSEPSDIGQEEIGGKYDLYIVINKKKYFLHVKTGKWKSWPKENMTFGIHYGQSIEQSNSPLILVSYLARDESTLRIEGFITNSELANCKIIRSGELFPNCKYPSRTDNHLTYFYQYTDINKIIDYLTNT